MNDKKLYNIENVFTGEQMNTHADKIRDRLFELEDKEYKEFTAKLIPTVDKGLIIGIRSPILKKFAKTLTDEERTAFLSSLPHKYLEENLLHSTLISAIKDFDECISRLNAFLPLCDNWAVIDTISPKKAFKGHIDDLKAQALTWQQSSHEFTIRYGIKVFMDFFLSENFAAADTKQIAAIKSDKLYVNLMIAWYFATALAKKYEYVLPFFETPCMDKWTHNKAIQKAIESFRVSDERKKYLKTLRI